MVKTDGSVTLEFGGEALVLLPDRAVFWPARNTLLVADVHLGKGAAFRAAGLPIPSGSTSKDLNRLAKLLAESGANRLVILGDFLHAKSGRQPEAMESIAHWRGAHREVEMILIRGNHDRGAGRTPESWNIREVEEPYFDDSLVLTHDRRCEEADGRATICGHVHPVIRMLDFDRSTVSAPVFVLDDQARCATLPAFGSFTGGHAVSPRAGVRLFVATGKKVTAAAHR